jgi:hypothetical protein
MSKRETIYQARLIAKLEQMFPDCFVIKNNPDEIQGIPDLLILFESQWAMLEVKISADADFRPNQPYYVSLFDQMSFCAFIYPEIEEEVLDALQSAFGIKR